MYENHRAETPTGPYAEPQPFAQHAGPGTGWPLALRVRRRVCPAEARTAVRRVITGLRARGTVCDEEAVADVLLVVSELTTNAMLHGGGVTEFGVEAVPRGVRVTVGDRSDQEPVQSVRTNPRARHRPGGYGWPIICRLSRAVRVSRLPGGGKRITAVLPLG